MSSSAYSVIGDLYGVETSRAPVRKGGLGLVIIMLLGGMFLYESIHPVMRLRSEPPPSFLKANRTTATTGEQDPMAESYWNLAASFVTEKYTYGEFLPVRPPEEFTMAMGGDYANSSVYWQRLRSLWNHPENWVRSYQLDTSWISGAMDSARKIFKSYLNA
ncbi:MAG: hypothetical protein EPN47_02800 [Acidobacteria bacterium]|nr:MAG: hypothetical protein EPN47_02800 [Acidobacteriota bacterium]